MGNRFERRRKKEMQASILEQQAAVPECSDTVHAFKFNLCMECKKNTICRQCTLFFQEMHVCKLCLVMLEMMNEKKDSDRMESLALFS